MRLVVDASAAYLMLGQPCRVEAAIAAASDFMTPELIVAELLNARWKVARSGAHAPALATILALFERFRFVSTLAYAADADSLAHRLDHSIYDCLYAAIAACEQAQLLTADDRFARKLSSLPIGVVLC